MTTPTSLKKFFLLLAAALVVLSLVLSRHYLADPHPSASTPAQTAADNSQTHPAQDTTGKNLTIPPGFALSIYAQNLPQPRDLLWVKDRILVSTPSNGQVIELLDTHGNGWSNQTRILLSGLNRPHGLAYQDNQLFVAETHQVSVYHYTGGYPPKKQKVLFSLPAGGLHWTRSLLIANDKLYVSVGSSCHACHESDLHRSTILVSNLDGSGLRSYSTGLRNAAFLTARPDTSEIFATENNHIQTDEINKIEDGKDYGWPYCFGKNILDDSFTQAKYQPPPGQSICAYLNKTGSLVDLQARSTPLGLAFTPKVWPQNYQNKLLVALHGSSNRATPAGYKIILIEFDLLGQPTSQSDFISGWLKPDGKTIIGQPVDLEFDPAGNLYISDDYSGLVYQLSPPGT